MRRRLVVAFGLAVTAGLATAGWLAWALLRPGPAFETTLEVSPGTAAREVLTRAGEIGLVPSPIAARLYLALAAGGRSVHWGRYSFEAGVRPHEVLDRLLEGAVDLISVTVVEGSILEEVAARFAAAGIGEAAQWQAVAARVGWVRDLAPGAPSLEGFLFPDTYRFAVGTTPERVARHMVRRFHTVWDELTAGRDGTQPVLELVTLASLVEAETHLPEERALIAGVFRNRLHRGMLLQCDPTVVFALRQTGAWRGRLLRRDLLVDHPYNTYRYPGLPPGPINSPGRAALRAALEPAATDALYFVARPDGGHAFSRTLAEHNRAVAELRGAAR